MESDQTQKGGSAGGPHKSQGPGGITDRIPIRDLFGNEVAPAGRSARGLPEWQYQPPTEWLRSHEAFTIQVDVEPLLSRRREKKTVRLTFRKRYSSRRREPQSRSPTWNAFLYKTGQRKDLKEYDTISVYAGTDETFDLAGVLEKLRKQMDTQRLQNAKIERAEIEPQTHSPTALRRRPYLKSGEKSTSR